MSRFGLQTYARGFTVVEIMVTVGILVLVAAGVASIFSSISETVNTGRRVAEINRFSAQLERVMREDFERMTRDGYLVIANQYTSTSDGTLIDARLSASDRSDMNNNGTFGHPRRIDEIMFFARGDFETSRRAISPSMIARSSEAAIYYGHGQKRRPDFVDIDPGTGANLFFNPQVTDTNIDPDARLAVRASSGFANPNEYASDWSLLRQVTLLVEPQSAGQELPASVFGVERTNENNEDRRWLEDSSRQIALQPASRSIFSSLGRSGYFVATAPSNYEIPKRFSEYDEAILPDRAPSLRSSGLVDIVTEDLSSIRTILMGLSNARRPFQYWRPPTEVLPREGYEDFVAQFWEDDPSDTDMLGPDNASLLNIDNPSTQHVRNMRQWMIDSLPSIWDQRVTGSPVPLSRVRYEDVPTRLIYDDGTFTGTDDAIDRKQIFAEANQEMLGSSVFVPRCTEFIVEWSLGHVDQTITDPTDPRYKKMLWFGLERWVDTNENGLIEPSGFGFDVGQDQLVASYYSLRPDPGLGGGYDRGPNVELITGQPSVVGGFGSPPSLQVSTFGYPDLSGRQWAWPKFIRVTISLADPLDPLIERTFQMVFEIPDASGN